MKKDNSNNNFDLVCELLASILVLGLLILSPVFVFCAGWFGGWILCKVLGTFITNGTNVLFNTTRFTVNIIPIVCGTLAVVGSYFTSHQTINKK